MAGGGYSPLVLDHESGLPSVPYLTVQYHIFTTVPSITYRTKMYRLLELDSKCHFCLVDLFHFLKKFQFKKCRMSLSLISPHFAC